VLLTRNSLFIALGALRKNKLQTTLTMAGMTIGVATVLTMIALGTGAQSAIQDQIRSAGMNLIIVTAGNYQAQQEALPSDAIEPSAFVQHGPRTPPRLETLAWDPASKPPLLRSFFHPEDDPMAKHDHPVASQRLGDSEAGLGSAATLTISDADAIRKIKGVQYVSEGVHENAHIVFENTRWFTRMHGDDVAMPLIRRAWNFPHGRYFNKREEANAEQVIVLGSIVGEKLFGATNPVGKTVKLWHQPFTVVGTLTSSSYLVQPAPGDDQFDAIYLPVTTVQRLLNLSKLNDITITTLSTGDVSRVSKDVANLLRVRHHITSTRADDFTVTSQARQALAKGGMRPEVARAVVGNVSGLEKVTLAQLGQTLDRASATMTALLASIAAVSLLVGGIGIMNIMLLSVTERTREIGVRRAVGACSRDVLAQFLMEAITLSVVGGLLGIVIGYVASGSISKILQWSTTISFTAVLVSFGISAAVGVFFGYYPARQASQVLPITSLRYE
jgi:putative ABC transport system permease protein